MPQQPYWDASLGRYVDPVTESVRTDVSQRAPGYNYTPLPKANISNPGNIYGTTQPASGLSSGVGASNFPAPASSSPFVGGSMPSTFMNPTANTINQANQNPASVTSPQPSTSIFGGVANLFNKTNPAPTGAAPSSLFNTASTIGNTGYNASGTQPGGGQPAAAGGFSNIGSPTDPNFWDPNRQPSYGTLPPGVQAPLMTDVNKGFLGQPTRYSPWTGNTETPTSTSDFWVRNQILAGVNKDMGYSSDSPTFFVANQSTHVKANNVKAWDMYSQRMQAAGLGNMVGPEPAAIAAARNDPAVMAMPEYPQQGANYGAPTPSGINTMSSTGGTNQYPSGAAPMGPQGGGTSLSQPSNMTQPQLAAAMGTAQNLTPNVEGFFGQLAQSYPELASALSQLLGPTEPYVDQATAGMNAAYQQDKANQDIELQSRFANEGSYLSSPMFAAQGQFDANLAAQHERDVGTMQETAYNNQANRKAQTAGNLSSLFSDLSKQAMASGSMLQASEWQTMADVFKTMTGADTARYQTDVGAQTSRYNTDVGASTSMYNTDAGTYQAQLQYNLGQAGLGVEQTKNVMDFLNSSQALELQGQGMTFDQIMKIALTSAGADQSIIDKLYAASQQPGQAGLNLFQLLSGIQNVASSSSSPLAGGLMGLLGGAGQSGSNIFSSILTSLMTGAPAFIF